MVRLPKELRAYMVLKCLYDEEEKYKKEVGLEEWWRGLTAPAICSLINKSWKIEHTGEGKVQVTPAPKSRKVSDKILSLSTLYKYIRHMLERGYIVRHWTNGYGPPFERSYYKLTNQGEIELQKLRYSSIVSKVKSGLH